MEFLIIHSLSKIKEYERLPSSYFILGRIQYFSFLALNCILLCWSSKYNFTSNRKVVLIWIGIIFRFVFFLNVLNFFFFDFRFEFETIGLIRSKRNQPALSIDKEVVYVHSQLITFIEQSKQSAIRKWIFFVRWAFS